MRLNAPTDISAGSRGERPPCPERRSTLSTNRPTSNSAARRERRAAQRSQKVAAGRPTPRGGGTPIPKALRSPVALITIAVVLVAAIGVGAILVQNAIAGSTGAMVTPSYSVPTALAHGRSIGSSTAPVKLDEWEDFQCPFCDQYTLNVEPHLISQYVTPGQVQITYHDFSFIGQASFDAAVAARCAGDQGQFWPYEQYLFYNQGTENTGWANRSLFDSIAKRLGLDQAKFDACLADPSTLSAVQAETTQGKGLGIQGTPTLFINGKQYSGGLDVSSISSAIDTALQAAPAASPSGSPVTASPAAGSPTASPAAS